MAIAARGSRAEHTGSNGTEGFPAAWAGFMNEGAAPGCHPTPPAPPCSFQVLWVCWGQTNWRLLGWQQGGLIAAEIPRAPWPVSSREMGFVARKLGSPGCTGLPCFSPRES